MNSVEIKNKIIQQVEYFDDNQLEAFYTVLLQFIDDQNEIGHDSELDFEQKDGNINSINNTEKGDKISHEQLIREMRAKYRQ